MWKEWRGYFIKASRESYTARVPARSFLAPRRTPALSLLCAAIIISSRLSSEVLRPVLRETVSGLADQLAKNNKQFVRASFPLLFPLLSSSHPWPKDAGKRFDRYPDSNRGLNRRLCGSPFVSVRKLSRARHRLMWRGTSEGNVWMFVLLFLFLFPSCFSDTGLRGIGGFELLESLLGAGVRSFEKRAKLATFLRWLSGWTILQLNGIINYWLFPFDFDFGRLYIKILRSSLMTSIIRKDELALSIR